MSSGDCGQDGAERLLAGRYRVVRQLGRGGMGIVCLAVDEVLGREVAVKELRTFSDASGPDLAELRQRMQREARAAARVRHPGVIAVHDVADDEGRPVIVMELVDGPSLDDVLRERGTLDPREAAGIGAKVMDALDAAHRAGVLHRDVKPGNVLLDRGGRVVLTDFGIAAMEDPGGETTKLTRTGDIVGSLDYLPPERAQGQPPGPASDIWALGATLYAAVEGGSPFRRTSTWSTLSAIVTEPLPEPRRAGPLAPVLRALMDKNPQARPDARRARELLEEVAAGGAPAAGDVVPPGPATPDHPGFGPAPDLSQPTPAQLPPDPQGPPPAGHPAPFPGQGAPVGGYGYPAGAAPGHPGAVPLGGAGPVGGGPAVPGTDTPPGAARTARLAGRRRGGRTALAAAAVIAVLAGAGTTAVWLGGDDGEDTGASAAASEPASPGGSGAEGEPGGKDGEDGKPKDPGETSGATEPAEERPADDGAKAGGGEGDGPDGGQKDQGEDEGGSGGGSGGAGGGSDDAGGGSGGSGGGDPAPAPVCHAIGGGKFNCEVWRTADSYDGAGNKKGVLNAGTNYFFCQTQGRRESYGKWTNTWWARTDDDSGNTGVYVSDVYIKGGDNDQPLPGLPVC